MFLLLLLTCFFLLCLVRHFLGLLLSPKTERHIGFTGKKYPHVDPFLGLDLSLQTWRDFHRGVLSEGIRKRHVRYGRTFVTNNLGAECIYTIDPENIRAITTRDFEKWGKSGWVAEAAKHVGHGVLLNEGPAWKQSRTMLKPMFARTAAMDEPALLEPHVRRLVASMRCRASSSSSCAREKEEEGVFDFHELASMFTLDVVTEFLFGKSTNCLERPQRPEGEDGVHFLRLVKDFEGPSGQFIALGPLAWVGLLPSYKRLLGLVDGMKAFFKRKLHEIITEANACAIGPGRPWESPPRSLEAVVSPSVFRSMKAAGASVDQIQGELQNIFFASYDTTSTFLANLLHVLVHHPEVQQRLREEIAFLEGRPPSQKDLSRMGFLRLVILEALRLYSPVSSHSRTANFDTTLPRGGDADGQSPILVRAGATVIWSTYSLNRDAQRYGEDWADFRPDRWTNLMRAKDTTTTCTSPNGSTGEQDERRIDIGGGGGTQIGEGPHDALGGIMWRDFFMPFGSGPRSCLGQQMVQTEVSYVLVRLLQEFGEITIDKADIGRPFREAKAVSFYNDGGVRIRVN